MHGNSPCTRCATPLSSHSLLRPLPRAEPHLVARVLRQDVQRAHRQPELATVRELAYARSQVHQLVPGYLRQAAQP